MYPPRLKSWNLNIPMLKISFFILFLKKFIFGFRMKTIGGVQLRVIVCRLLHGAIWYVICTLMTSRFSSQWQDVILKVKVKTTILEQRKWVNIFWIYPPTQDEIVANEGLGWAFFCLPAIGSIGLWVRPVGTAAAF